MNPYIGVVILNWKRWPDTLACLHSLQQAKGVRLEVVVVDNGSGDESVTKIREWCDQNGRSASHVSIAIYPQDKNYGFAEGCNRGLRILKEHNCAYFLLLNNDTIVDPDALCEMVKASHETSADLVGAHVLGEDRTTSLYVGRSWPGHIFGFGAIKQDAAAEIWPTDQVDGSCFLMTQKFLARRWKDSGYALDPGLFLYCEDSDLAIYGKANGFKAVVAARARVYHGLSKSSGGAGNHRSFYYISRNRIYLANRWLTPALKFAFHIYYISSRVLLMALYGCQGRGSVSRAIWMGLVDGYRGVQGPLLEGRL